ncbi:hypothetical protein C5S53_14390 [Methanophagales archaeon]|nr:hypothetical protein C5S53_14390 [Methanophagales archaeon]
MKAHVIEKILNWLFLLIGILLTGSAGVLSYGQFSFLLLFIIIILGISFLIIAVWRIIGAVRIKYTPSEGENWKIGMEMIEKMNSDWRGYDISSYKNRKDFEDVFLEKATSCRFNRIIACDPKKDVSTKDWIETILDPAKDTDNRYKNFRRAIKDDKMKILHLPHQVYADFFIIENEKRHKGEVIFGFPKTLADHTYQAGMYIKKNEIAVDFNKFFTDTIFKLCEQHLRDEENKDVDRCEICKKFDHKRDFTSLLPKEEKEK